jgi:hypothetical protein
VTADAEGKVEVEVEVEVVAASNEQSAPAVASRGFGGPTDTQIVVRRPLQKARESASGLNPEGESRQSPTSRREVSTGPQAHRTGTSNWNKYD